MEQVHAEIFETALFELDMVIKPTGELSGVSRSARLYCVIFILKLLHDGDGALIIVYIPKLVIPVHILMNSMNEMWVFVVAKDHKH